MVADFSHSPDVQNITRTYGFLRIVASGVVLCVVALMLYLSGRGRSQLVTSAFLRRMGITQHSQALSVALEASVLVALGAVGGVVAALITSGAIVRRVDPLQYSPTPVTDIPGCCSSARLVGVIVAAGLVGAILTLGPPWSRRRGAAACQLSHWSRSKRRRSSTSPRAVWSTRSLRQMRGSLPAR